MNNWWEDLEMDLKLKENHEEMINTFNLPEWTNVICPFCKIQLKSRSIRSIQMLFNARNIGDIAVEFCCDDCKKMDTMYFHNSFSNIEDFCNLLKKHDAIESENYILEDDMYKLNYNNLLAYIFKHKESI
jgi:hypothetical protein